MFRVRLEGWLRWSSRPFGGVECRGHVQSPASVPGSSEVAAGFLVFLYLVWNFPQLCMHAVTFSVSYCWRRGLCRYKHLSEGPQASACLISEEFWRTKWLLNC